MSESQAAGSQAELELLVQTARQIFTEPDAAKAWHAIEESGLHLLAAPEPEGGDWLAAAVAVTKVAGEMCAPIPYGDIAILAAPVLASLHLPFAGAIAVAEGSGLDHPDDEVVTLDVTAPNVPGGRHAPYLALCHGNSIALVPSAECEITESTNLAGETRDRVRFDGRVPYERNAFRMGLDDEVRTRGALARAAAICGAASAALKASITYANERVQFGRPIAKFQVIQHSIAEIAVEVEAMTAATDAATAICARESFLSDRARIGVAVAKAQASAGAGIIARNAHQVHGAIGTTKEHSLHTITTRLWSWRDEYGSERFWQAELGRAALEKDVWEVVT